MLKANKTNKTLAKFKNIKKLSKVKNFTKAKHLKQLTFLSPKAGNALSIKDFLN